MITEIIGSSGIPYIDYLSDFTLTLVLLVLVFDFIITLVSPRAGRKG